ncbi:MAG: DUF4230 domain-containing protein [Bacteroidales bacterium]|nr:DUF4230 domain-containing protein [Bacteroidales bacterium]
MKKLSVKVILIIVLALIVIIVVPSVKKLFTKHEVKVETSISVEDIQKIGEVVSARYYCESAGKRNKGLFDRQELVVIGKVTLRAGFDLTKVEDDDIRCEGETLYLNLPKVEILDVIGNPQDFPVLTDVGSWSHDEYSNICNDVKKSIVEDAISRGLLDEAQTNGVKILRNMLKCFGFKEIYINVSSI